MPPRRRRAPAWSQGDWWPADYDGPPLVSFDAGMAKGWHVGIGDVIRVNVLGRDIDLKIANLRNIAWQSLGINFFMVASPGLLAHAPHTHIATVRIADAAQGGLLRAVTDALPNVTGIRVEDVLVRHRRAAQPGGGGADGDRGADLARRHLRAGGRGGGRAAAAGAGGGDPENPRRHPRRRSAPPG